MYNNATTTFPYEYIRTFSTSRKICERTVKHLAAKFLLFLFQTNHTWLHVKLFYTIAGVPWSHAAKNLTRAFDKG